MKIYEYAISEEDETSLPELSEGEVLSAASLEGKQHFTQPPARYTEASFVKLLEEKGIGRPSTYVPTISTWNLSHILAPIIFEVPMPVPQTIITFAFLLFLSLYCLRAAA